VVETPHVAWHRRSVAAALSDAADRLAQALRDLISEALQDMRRLMPIIEARQQLGGISPPRSTRWSTKAKCRSLRSAAARLSRRKNSTISSGESDMTLPVGRNLQGELIRRERHLRR
jgi:hypothetical protein